MRQKNWRKWEQKRSFGSTIAIEDFAFTKKLVLERLAMVSATNTIELFNRLLAERISPLAIEFAHKILEQDVRNCPLNPPNLGDFNWVSPQSKGG
jgi:flagellar biosynthesis/type III secretory pathway protein FliH